MTAAIRGRRRWWWGLVLCAWAVSATAALPDPIDRCLAQIGAGRHDANVDLCVACPGVAAAIRQPAVAAMLDKRPRCPLKLAEAADVAAYRQDVTRTPPAGGPSAAALAPVLAELELKPQAADGWWERFRRWLRQWLTDDEGAFPPWLEEWLKALSLPAWFGDAVFKIALLAILVLAAVIVFSELRAVRWRRRARRSAGAVDGAAGTQPAPRTLADVRALPLAAQPGALLQYVIAQLVRTGRLPDRRDETNHELAVRLGQRAPALAASFGDLVTDVERAVYGGRRLDAAGATMLWRNAEDVLANSAAIGTDKR